MTIVHSKVCVNEVMVHNDHKLINYKATGLHITYLISTGREKHEEIMMFILNCIQSDAVIGQKPTAGCRKI